MASTESYLYFVLDQLKDLKTITYKKNDEGISSVLSR